MSKNDTDFENADNEVGLVVTNGNKPVVSTLVPSNVIRFREQLLLQYHNGASSLIDRLHKNGKQDIDSLLGALIDEVVSETDHLLGNELVATHNGDLRDASVISFKRTEALEKAIKAVQAKQEFERTGGIDVDSPAMVTVFKFFMEKARDALQLMGVDSELNDLFFNTLADVTGDWKKELQEEFESLNE